jgi:hypothetical protein
MPFPVQNLIVQKRTKNHKAGPIDAPVALYNADGTPFAPLAPKGAAVPDAAGEAPTKTEFDALLKSLRDAGLIASS